MPNLRVGVLADLHAGGTVDQYVSVGAASDGGWPRIYSNWSQRLTEFTTACSQYNVDLVVLLGDNVDNAATDKEATWTAVLTQVYSELGDIHFVPLIGNHERATTGDGTMTIIEWNTIWNDSDLDTSYSAVVTGIGKLYPDWQVANKQFSTYMYIVNADFGVVALTGLLKGGAAFDHWDSDIQDYDGVADATVHQLEWLRTQGINPGGSLGARHKIVLCHYPMVAVDEATLDLPDKIMDGNPDGTEDPIQTQLTAHVAATAPVTAITGHYHDVRHGSPRYLINTVGNVPYLHLRGSVLGKNLSDDRGNTFYIIDIDKAAGITDVKTFQYIGGSRIRYAPTDIDNVMKTDSRGRRN